MIINYLIIINILYGFVYSGSILSNNNKEKHTHEIVKNALRSATLRLANRIDFIDNRENSFLQRREHEIIYDLILNNVNENQRRLYYNELRDYTFEIFRLDSIYTGEDYIRFYSHIQNFMNSFITSLYNNYPINWPVYTYNPNTREIFIEPLRVCVNPNHFQTLESGNIYPNNIKDDDKKFGDKPFLIFNSLEDMFVDPTSPQINNIAKNTNGKLQMTMHHIIPRKTLKPFFSTLYLRMANHRVSDQGNLLIQIRLRYQLRILMREYNQKIFNPNYDFGNLLMRNIAWHRGNVFWGPTSIDKKNPVKNLRGDDPKIPGKSKESGFEKGSIVIIGEENYKIAEQLDKDIQEYNEKLRNLHPSGGKWTKDNINIISDDLYFEGIKLSTRLLDSFEKINNGSRGKSAIKMDFKEWVYKDDQLWYLADYTSMKNDKNINKKPDDDLDPNGSCGSVMPSLRGCISSISKREIVPDIAIELLETNNCISKKLLKKVKLNNSLLCEYLNSTMEMSYDDYILKNLQNENTESLVKKFSEELCNTSKNYNKYIVNNFNETIVLKSPIEDNMNKWCQSFYIFLNPLLLMYCVAAGY